MRPFQPNCKDHEESLSSLLNSNYTPEPNNVPFHQMPAMSPFIRGDRQWHTPYSALSTETEMLNHLVAMGEASLPVSTLSSRRKHEPNCLQQREWNYELIVVQQPIRARICGFGDKDCRPVNPPPIIELIITTKDGKRLDPDQVDIAHYIVHCDRWQADGVTQANIIAPTDPSKRLELQKT